MMISKVLEVALIQVTKPWRTWLSWLKAERLLRPHTRRSCRARDPGNPLRSSTPDDVRPHLKLQSSQWHQALLTQLCQAASGPWNTMEYGMSHEFQE